MKNESYTLAVEIINYLFEHRNPSVGYYSSFSYFVDHGQPCDSRLAWCYGDLGIAYILFQAAVAFEDAPLKQKALDILIKASNRLAPSETGIKDAGICHGTAGVAHIFGKLQRANSTFFKPTNYWIHQTLRYAVYEDGVAGYKAYDGETMTMKNIPGLLNDSYGIGLVLLSYIRKEYDWDYCLMLND